MDTIGQKIKYFRERAGMSQLDLEVAIDASTGSISRMETGKVNPTKETLISIVDVLDIKGHEAASLFNLDIQEFIKIMNLSKSINKLSLDEVLQRSVNEVVYELGMLGAFLVLIDGDRVYSKTVTQTWFTKLALEIINAPFNSLNISLTKDKDNLMVRSIVEQKVFITNRLADCSTPFVPTAISDLLQRVTTLKSGIIFPIIYEEKSIGAIFFGKDHIDEFIHERPVLAAFCEHIALAIANAEKYQILEQKLINSKPKPMAT
jgi:transcriptional regulator with XRE-family HTH domain